MLRIAGWFSGIFFLIFGAYFEIIALSVLSTRPRNAAEWIPLVFYVLVPLGYGISVIRRMSAPDEKADPQTTDYVDADADAANDAELEMLIQRLKQPS